MHDLDIWTQCLTNVAVIGPVEDNYRRGEPINHLVQAPDETVAELPHSPQPVGRNRDHRTRRNSCEAVVVIAVITPSQVRHHTNPMVGEQSAERPVEPRRRDTKLQRRLIPD